MKQNQIVKSLIDFEPLFRKGDTFKILTINSHPDLLPLECLSLRNNQVYGFEYGEVE